MPAFLAFLAAYMLSHFYRTFLAVIAPDLAKELSLSPQILANMQACWLIGFTLLQIPVGYLLDTLGPRRTTSATMLCAAVGALTLFAGSGVAFLYAGMLLIGMGCASIYMGAAYVIGRTETPARFALVTSWLLALGSLGNLLSASPLALAAETMGWRNALLAMGMITLISAAVVHLVVRDPGRVDAANHSGFLKGLSQILAIRALWPLIPLVAVSYSGLIAERSLWAGPYLADVHGAGTVERGNIILFFAAAMAAGPLLYGRLDLRLGRRKLLIATGTVLTAACFIWLALGVSTKTQATMALAGIGFTGITYGVLMAHGRVFFPDHLLGRGMTFLNTLFMTGAALIQPLSGALVTRLKDQGLAMAEVYSRLHLAFALMLLAAAFIYLFSQEKPA
jgi:MFS family permease